MELDLNLQKIELAMMITGINHGLEIPEKELRFTFSRSSGPGGQNVNKVSTKVTLQFDIDRSASISEQQKARIKKKLASRISRNGVLRVTAGYHRTQKANREAVVKRFYELLASALAERRPRKRTKVSWAAKERRLKAKRHRSRIKQTRSKRIEAD